MVVPRLMASRPTSANSMFTPPGPLPMKPVPVLGAMGVWPGPGVFSPAVSSVGSSPGSSVGSSVGVAVGSDGLVGVAVGVGFSGVGVGVTIVKQFVQTSILMFVKFRTAVYPAVAGAVTCTGLMADQPPITVSVTV